MKVLSYISLTLALCVVACCTPQQKAVTIEQINAEAAAGNFTNAKQLVDLYLAQNTLSQEEVYNLSLRKDTMDRITLDFKRTKTDIVEYISKYYPDVTNEMLAEWEESKALEAMVIDGEKRYFNRAAPNLFLLDESAKKRKLETDGEQIDGSDEVLKQHLPEVVAALEKNCNNQHKPIPMKVTYTVTLKPNTVPDGEVIRCWLPYPREDSRRQANVKLLAVSSNNYTISPNAYQHSTLYMQEIAEKDKPLVFSVEFSYTSAAEWFNLTPEKVKPYNESSGLYKTYTAQREAHVVFTDRIKQVSDEVVGSETNPYLKVQKIFGWISKTYPWAGAREYSTIPNIPEYVLENGHGDCGQVGLLFITLARYNGIPTRWQSGFMMHPREVNLHDWAEVYFEGVGWVPVDPSFGRKNISDDERIRNFYASGIDAYRWIVNDDFSCPLFPAKIYQRSETVDFQRGELEWKGGNLYFDKWSWDMDVQYLN